ncbi:hypothetical protein R3P38DRAFT_3264791 [Favolaschia claudopus]|uniref:Uncharacterized protein n=1 Tax=Favolaschia claudopus TaxID=2862362 RepID=A0AAW0C009_9AGAR
MNESFTFPARPQPLLRPPPAQPQAEPVNRESNALRASVLDAALQLGFGANGTVANWMFNNAVEEEEEEDEVKDPLSPSSEDHANSSYSTPPTSISSHSDSYQPSGPPKVHFPVMPVTAISTPPPFPEPPVAPFNANKLRKPKRPDGYESDGGYVSDSGKKSRVRTKSKTSKDAPQMPISEPMELIPLTKEERKRRKKEAKSSTSKDGAETDAEDVSKSKSKPTKAKKKDKKDKQGSADVGAGGGYETDDGYVSSSGKKSKSGRRFFSLRKKSADNSSEAAAPPEPVPALPPMPDFDLPIASRFGTTFEGGSSTPSRSETPLLPPSRPFAGPGIANSGSSASSISSSANSLLTPVDQESFSSGGPRSIDEGGDKSLRGEHFNSPAQYSPPSTANSHSPSGKGKFAMTFPLSRTGSANSMEPNTNNNGKHVPSPISTLSPGALGSALNSRAPSPIAGSPFVVLTPINTNTSSFPRAVSPSPSENFAPSSDYIVPSRSASPLPPRHHPGDSSSTSSSSTQHPPNVLAYYNTGDVPPPSPPPISPLPRAPPSSAGRAKEPMLGVTRIRGMSQDRGGGRSVSPSPPGPLSPMNGGGALSPIGSGQSAQLRPLSPGGLASPISPGGVQRGRAAPFPMSPVSGNRPPVGSSNGGMGSGLAARVNVERYRDLYAIQIPATPVQGPGSGMKSSGASASAGGGRRKVWFEDEDKPRVEEEEVGIRVEDWDEGSREEEEEEADEMRHVLGRFRDPQENKARRMGIALERNNSGALRPGIGRPIRSSSPAPIPDDVREAYSDDDEASQYPDEDRTAGRSTMYRVENGGRDTIRWSEYEVDARASFLEVENSEKARGTLVDRVGKMYDSSGREKAAVPPVPKIPAGLVGVGNRF